MSEERAAVAPVETPTAPPVPEPTGPGTATAAQEQLKATERPPTILTEKPAETPAPAPEAPAPFEAEKITFPEGFAKNEEVFAKFSEFAKANGMTLPAAQQLINDFYVPTVQAIEANQRKAWETTLTGWEAEVKADAQLAKETFRTTNGTLNGLDAVKAVVGGVMDNPALTHPNFRTSLELTGMGSNHPAVWTLYHWAKALTEGSYVEGAGPAPDAGRRESAARTAAETLYPNLPRGA